ncbi:MAG TPA: histidinol-phosphate transaminase [Polyangiales bacterium]|nr:histidinol-phosphate transaminase [Polyangiales bacterium]
MKPLVAPHIASLTPYIPGKPIEELERELGIHGAVKLASNESALGPSPRVVDAVRAAAACLHRYPDDTAHALRSRLADMHRVSIDEVCLGHGSNELIDLSVRAFATPREHAVIGSPTFSCYGLSLHAADVPTTVVPLRDSLFWDLDRVLAAVQPETKLVYLDNPGNPTSTHIADQALRAFLRALPADVIAVIDEAYFEFATAADYASALGMRDLRERLIVMRTFSKAYALAGLRLGYAIARPQLISYLQRVRVPFNANSVVQAAALAALDDDEHLRRSVALNDRERARMSDALWALGLAVAPSQTNFVCVQLDRPAKLVYEALLRAGVIVRPFGPPLDRHLRISVGLPEENDRLLRTLPVVMQQVAPTV